MISVKDVCSIILACCGGIITIGGAISVIVGWLSRIRAPEAKQNEQIAGLLCRVEKLEKNDSEKREARSESRGDDRDNAKDTVCPIKSCH